MMKRYFITNDKEEVDKKLCEEVVLKEELRQWVKSYEELIKTTEKEIEIYEQEGFKELGIFMSGRKIQMEFVVARLKEILFQNK